MSTYRRYTALDIHGRLIERHPDPTRGGIPPERQAYRCPYFVPLSGVLGSDWGVCVNPASIAFGRLLFEHDDCGCPGPCPRGNQRANRWVKRESPEEMLAAARARVGKTP